MIIVAVLAVLAVAIVAFSGGQHGPGRHVGAGDPNAAPATTAQAQLAASNPDAGMPAEAGR